MSQDSAACIIPASVIVMACSSGGGSTFIDLQNHLNFYYIYLDIDHLSSGPKSVAVPGSGTGTRYFLEFNNTKA